jgi:putative peptidoglycan lipid II flippase
VPVANNVVCIAVLVWFHAVDPVTSPATSLTTTHLTLLGLGTTLGVVVQALLLAPSLARADLWRLSLRFNRRDPALRQIATLAGWSLSVVVANQISLFFVLAFAFGLGGDGPVSAYTYGWSFMQMPYAVVVVSVLNVLTPELAALASREEWEGFTERLARGLRQSLVIIVPLSFYLVVLAQPLVALLLHHGDGRIHLAAGGVLAVLAVGLPGFTIFAVCIRALQSMQRARDTFGLYLFQNAATVAGIFLFGRHRIEGLVGAIALAYTLAAAVALVVVRYRRASIAHVLVERAIMTSVVVSFATALLTAVVYNLYGWSEGLGLAARSIGASIVGATVYLVAMALLARRSTPRAPKGVRL